MSEFNVIETQEQFDKAIGERIKREQETISWRKTAKSNNYHICRSRVNAADL